MERYDLNPDRAFELLVRTSQTSNVKVHDVAETLIADVIRRADATSHSN